MRSSLLRPCAGGTSSAAVHRCMRHWIGLPPPSARRSRGRYNNNPTATDGALRWLASSGSGPSDEDIAELNKGISGFVGDLGDPDFDASPPSSGAAAIPSVLSRRGTSGSRGEIQAGGRLSGGDPLPEPRHRLTLADHPSVVRSAHDGPVGGNFQPPTERGTHRQAMMVSEGLQDDERNRMQAPRNSSKSVLVLNGAACFMAGRLASTGEPRAEVIGSMEKAAEELDLSVTVCSSNREDELVDELCDRDFDAVVYNPAGFGTLTPGTPTTATTLIKPKTHTTFAGEAGSQQVIGYTELGEGNSRLRQMQGSSDPQEDWRHQMRNDVREQPILREAYRRRWCDGSALEYALAHARCPVVVISPRDDAALGSRQPASDPGATLNRGVNNYAAGPWGDRGTISGFSGAVSYKLAMNAVAFMLDEAWRKR